MVVCIDLYKSFNPFFLTKNEIYEKQKNSTRGKSSSKAIRSIVSALPMQLLGCILFMEYLIHIKKKNCPKDFGKIFILNFIEFLSKAFAYIIFLFWWGD